MLKRILILITFAGLTIFPSTKIYAQDKPSVETKLNPQLSSCLKEKMGGTVFEEIKSGARLASETEKRAGEECFTKYGQDFMKVRQNEEKRNPEFSPETDKCLQSKLGADYKNKLKNAKSRQEGETLMSQARDCFGQKSEPIEGDNDEKRRLPDNVRSCIVNTIGKEEADKIFNGQKPTEGNDQFNKLENAGCFRGLNRDRRGEGRDLPPDKKNCIESVIGTFDSQPTETQKQEIGKKCFNNQQPRDGEGGDRPALPKEIESCLQNAIGSNFKDRPLQELSSQDREKAESCFRKNNFQPRGEKDQQQRPMNDETQKCVERVSGKSAESPEFDEETKRKVGKECFGVHDFEKNFEENKPQIPKSQDTIDCENKIRSGDAGQLGQGEIEKQIKEQCFKGEHFGESQKNGNRGSTPSNAGVPPQGNENLQPKDNGEKFCQENPSACQNNPPM